MTEAQETHFTIRGLKLAAKVWGDEKAPPMLAVHGWLDNANSFDFLAPYLPNRRIVALDLPGHGLSQHRSTDAAYHFVDYAVEVVEVADALGWERFDYLGHSLGAAIGSAIVGAIPERVTRSIWLDAIGPITSEAETMPDRLARFIREEQRGRDRKPRALPSRAAAVELLMSVVTKLSLASAQAIVARNTHEVTDGVMWTYDARLRGTSSSRLTDEQCLAFLKRISSPVLFLRAVDGMPFDEAQTRRRELAVSRLKKVEMIGGHHLHMEMPQEVARHIETFLRDA